MPMPFIREMQLPFILGYLFQPRRAHAKDALQTEEYEEWAAPLREASRHFPFHFLMPTHSPFGPEEARRGAGCSMEGVRWPRIVETVHPLTGQQVSALGWLGSRSSAPPSTTCPPVSRRQLEICAAIHMYSIGQPCVGKPSFILQFVMLAQGPARISNVLRMHGHPEEESHSRASARARC